MSYLCTMQEDMLDKIFNSSSLREELVSDNRGCGRYTCIIFVSSNNWTFYPQQKISNVEIGNLYNSYIYKPTKAEVDKIIIKNFSRYISRVSDLYLTSDIVAIDNFKKYSDMLRINQNSIFVTPSYGWTFDFNTNIKTRRECLKLLFFLKWCFMKDTSIFIIDNVTYDEVFLSIDNLSLEHSWLHRNKNRKYPCLVASAYTTTVSEELSDYFKIYARGDVR